MSEEIKPLHNELSAYRKVVLEHLFVGELLRALWPRHVEVMKPLIDDSGYDLVVEFENVVRHIRLRSSFVGSSTRKQTIHELLWEKPDGCIIWIFFDKETFELGPFLWFGSPVGEPLPCISNFGNAHHTKGDATGTKGVRPAIRVVPKKYFVELEDFKEVVKSLFGTSAETA